MNEPLCVAPFIGLYYKGSSKQIKACCESNEWHMKESNSYRFKGKGSWDEIWTNEKIQKIRKKLLEGEFPESCWKCQENESRGIFNARRWYKNILKDWEGYENKKLKYDIEKGNNTGEPLWIDFRSSNLCNLKCRMCSPSNSTELAKEYVENKHHFTGPERNLFNSVDSSDKLLYNKDYYDYLIDQIPVKNLVKAKFLGGEPTIQKEVFRFLRRLKGKEHIKTAFTSNGTNINKNFKEEIEHLPNVHLQLSIDGYDKSYEYIRTPGKWSTIQNNLNYLINELEIKGKLTFAISIVIQMYNIFDITNIMEFVLNTRRSLPRKVKGDPQKFHHNKKMNETFFSPVMQDFLSIELLEDEHRELIIKEINDFQKKYNLSDYEKNEISIPLLRLLRPTTDREKKLRKFRYYTNKLDMFRSTKLIDLHPNYERYMA